jgi:hypothetical protein
MKILRIPLVIVLAVVAGRTFTANAQTLTILHQFPATAGDGYYPEASLTRVGSTLHLFGIKYSKRYAGREKRVALQETLQSTV